MTPASESKSSQLKVPLESADSPGCSVTSGFPCGTPSVFAWGAPSGFALVVTSGFAPVIE